MMRGTWQRWCEWLGASAASPQPSAGRRQRQRWFGEPLEDRRLLAATPLITELMAAGQTILPSQFDGQFYDWIEIYNPGPGAIDLKDWYLTDQKNELHTWQFTRNVVVAEDEFLVVFASGYDSNVVDLGVDELHTNFRLSASGEYLALVRPDGTTLAAEYEPFYPPQTINVSYGLTASLDEQVFFTTPTPGQRNPTYFKNSVYSPRQGIYDQPLRVALDTSVLAAPIHYTTDGSVPTGTDPLYEDLISIGSNTTLRVKSFASESDGTVYTQTYIFPAAIRQPSAARNWPRLWTAMDGKQANADYAFDPEVSQDPRYVGQITEHLLALPTFALTMDVDDLFGTTQGIYSNPTQEGREWERPASIEMLYPDGRRGFQADAGIRVRGGASREPTNTPKHSFRIYFRSQYGPSILGEPIFEDGAVERFDRLELNAVYDDSWLTPDSSNRTQATLLRDQWLRDTIGAMGQPTVDGRFVHLYINGVYWGVYNITERVDDGYGAIHFGGAKLDFDVIDSGRVEEGTVDGWRALLDLVGAGVNTPEQFARLQQLMDVDNFVDFLIARLYAGDGQMGSGDWFAVRNRTLNEPFRFFASDAEQSLRGENDNVTNPVNQDDVVRLFRALQPSPLFRRAFGDRVHRHFFNNGALMPARTLQRWQQLSDDLGGAMIPESARWGDHRRDVQPQGAGATALYTLDDHWRVESQRLVERYFPARSNVVLGQFRALNLYPSVAAPEFSQFGGPIASGYRLSMAAAAGEIYYTLDGSDPAAANGAVGPAASPYTVPVTLDQTALVRARARVNGQWSAVTEAPFFTPLPLQLTELHVASSPDAANIAEPDLFDFVELTNVGNEPIDLRGVQFVRGIAFSFDTSDVQQLLPGERTVIVQNQEHFASRYGTEGIRVAGAYTGRLDASDRLLVIGSLGQPLLDVTLDEDWYEIVGAEHFSLVLRDESRLTTNLSDPQLWRPSHFVDGSPGTADPGWNPEDIVISEALTHSDGPLGDWLELHNTSDRDVDLSGWYLSGRTTDLRLYRIPDGTVLPADGYLLFSATEPDTPQIRYGGATGFSISKLGERIFLTSAGRNETELGGYRFVAEFTYGFNSSSFIRYTNSSGQTEYVVAVERTPGFANVSPPAVERIRDHNSPYREAVISEVMFYPQGAGDEFIELYNPHDREVSLELPFGPSWRFTDGVFYNFPDTPAPVLPPKSYTLVVGIDPESFRQKYNVPASVAIFGPYLGELLNVGERLMLARAAETAAFVPFSMSDLVHYNHPSGNWPAEANGQGASLIRRSYRAFGNDVTNWQAGSSGGTPGRPNQTWQGGPQIVDRMVFYNRSKFDGNDAAIGLADDGAVAVDKFPLLPGQQATFANYTSYARGLNGIMIDIRGLPGTPSLADLEFRVGTDGDPAAWPLAAGVAEFQLRRGAGYDRSDRLVVTWPDGAIANQWLRVRVKATAATGLAEDDLFYFGNAIGETGDEPGNTYVDGTDYARVRSALGDRFRLIEETDLLDVNRDGDVNDSDVDIVVQHVTNLRTALPLLLAPSAGAPLPAGAAGAADRATDRAMSGTDALGDVDVSNYTRAACSYDLDGNGRFDARDLQLLAAALIYETGQTATSGAKQGDWNGDGLFDSQDLVWLFQQGGFDV